MRSSRVLLLVLVVGGGGCEIDRSGLGELDDGGDASEAGRVDGAPVDADRRDVILGGDAGEDAGPPGCAGPPVVLYTFDVDPGGGAIADEAPAGPQPSLTVGGVDPMGVAFAAGAVEFSGGRLEASPADSEELGVHLSTAGSFAFEAWVTADMVTQPAIAPYRIVTLSRHATQRAFTVGQTETGTLELRIRTSVTTANGSVFQPPLSGEASRTSPVVFPRTEPMQIVGQYEGGGGISTLFVDGAQVSAITHLDRGAAATLSWDNAQNLLGLGDEFAEPRAWTGRVHRVALWDLALSAEAVRCLYEQGPDGPVL